MGRRNGGSGGSDEFRKSRSQKVGETKGTLLNQPKNICFAATLKAICLYKKWIRKLLRAWIEGENMSFVALVLVCSSLQCFSKNTIQTKSDWIYWPMHHQAVLGWLLLEEKRLVEVHQWARSWQNSVKSNRASGEYLHTLQSHGKIPVLWEISEGFLFAGILWWNSIQVNSWSTSVSSTSATMSRPGAVLGAMSGARFGNILKTHHPKSCSIGSRLMFTCPPSIPSHLQLSWLCRSQPGQPLPQRWHNEKGPRP